jgi:putative two-component system response regulator
VGIFDYTDPPTGPARELPEMAPARPGSPDDTVMRRDAVLVVDDDETVRDVLRTHLAKRGFDVLVARSSRQALEIFHEHKPPAVVTDIRMPDGDGFALLAELHGVDPDVVVVMTSGAPSVDLALRTLRAGAVDFMEKPFDFSALAKTLRKALLRRRSRQVSRGYQQHLESEIRQRTGEWQRALDQLRQSNRQLRESYEESLLMLRRASAFRDDETGHHIERIAVFSAELAREIGLPDDQVSLIGAASPMHDIGKIGIPDHILRKPGKLTTEEFNIMKSHTLMGWRILGGSETPLLAASAQIALTHHERWDGSGYPRGLAARRIPLAGRIVSVVDAWDALTHERVYKPAYSAEESLRTLKAASGTQFDPELVEAFCGIAHRMPELERAAEEGVTASYLASDQ